MRERLQAPGRPLLDSHIYGYMVSRMKTTVDLPDELLIRAKQRAAELRRPLRALLVEGLRAQLAPRPARRARRRRIRWVTVDGGLPPKLDVADRARMHEWLRRQS